MNSTESSFQVWQWTKSLCTLVAVLVGAAKLYAIPTTLTIDFPSLLSLLLALFSVALSALFYFKATDTSNAFYDNTYKFTKDIAELLVKIESGFGERLRHLDEGYSSMRNYLQNTPLKPHSDVESTKEKIADQQQEIEKVLAERNEIVQRLVEQSQLQQSEKDRVVAELASKEKELRQSQAEISRLNRHLAIERMSQRGAKDEISLGIPGISDFTFEKVVSKIGVDRVLEQSTSVLRSSFEDVRAQLPQGYLDDLAKHDLFDGALLTVKGAAYLRNVALKYREK